MAQENGKAGKPINERPAHRSAEEGNARAGGSLKRRSPGVQARASDNDETSEESNVMSNATAIPKENNAQATTAKIIPFRKKELLLVDNDGAPFVPMKPVVDGMGLAWQAQHAKLTSGRFSSTITIIVIVAEDGKRREMVCLPLRKLAGWLMSIHASKVRPDLRENVIAYQNECDDALWAYWNEDIAVRRDDRSAASVLSTTIGTDGFHCLGAMLDGKLRHLPAPARKRAKQHVWSQVHKAFSVVSAQDIPADQLDSVRNFIAAYALEGEFIGKQGSGAGTLLTDLQLYDVYFVCHHFNCLYEIFKRFNLYTNLTGLGSRAGVEMIDHFKDGSIGTYKLNKDLGTEFDAVQRRLKLNQYRA